MNARNPRPQVPIDPLMRLQQLEDRRPAKAAPRPAQGQPQRRSQQLPPPKPGSANRPVARPTAPTTGTVSPGVKPSAQAAARIAALAAARGTANSTAKGGPGARPGTKPAGKRAKPAKAAKMASLALSAVTTIGLAGMFAQQNGQTDAIVLTQGTLATAPTTPTTAAATADTTATTAVASNTAVTAAPATAAPVTAAPATAPGVKDGTYAGAGNANRWGTVQVQVVYSGGQIVDVQMLSYPNGDSRSNRISQIALPQLISETISAQSASVRTVSGATYTSKSYKKTLQSAIDTAKAASGVA